jgi:hypothetical protein
MSQRGPLITAVVVVGGLVGLMTANSAGGLVTPANTAADQTGVAATSEDIPESAAPPAPPVTTTIPTTTTTAPPVDTTATDVPASPPALPAEAVYAGRAADSPLAIAVAVEGDEAAAYLCDGASVEAWLKGTAKDGVVELSSNDGATTLTASLSGESLAGTVTIAGQPQDFTIPVAPAPAGVYRGEGAATIGWIIMPDGTQVGIARTSSGVAPAPPLDPAKGSVTVGGTRVAAEKVTGETTFG